jgi:hypothetical protein
VVVFGRSLAIVGYCEGSVPQSQLTGPEGAGYDHFKRLSSRQWSGVPMLRKIASRCVVIIVIGSVLSAQTGTAVLYGTGAVYVNGAQLSNSSAVTAGDVIQTKETGAANLNGVGATIVIQSNTIARMQPGGLSLDRGSVTVATGNSMSVFARDLKITPVSNNWTEFYVSRVSGGIQIVARKNDVTIDCGSSNSRVREGHEETRQDSADCGIAARKPGAIAAAKGPLLTSPWAEVAGIGAGGGLLGWILLQGDQPASPSVP